MSKVTAPLLSFGASGQVGKAVVYATWRGVKYARRHVIPGNPNTTAQQTQRNSFAMLREMYKRTPAVGIAPWDAYAKGRPFTGMNAFIGENRRVIKTDANMQKFIGSPGSGGGLPLTSASAATGSSSGEIDMTYVEPTAPVDWTQTYTVFGWFPDQAPSDDFVGPYEQHEIAAGSTSYTISGLTAGGTYDIASWTIWTKPDGSTAYGPSLITHADAHA